MEQTQMETIRLYDEDAYGTEFDARVLICTKQEKKDGQAVYQVILDRTLFFPEEGGQSPDKGTITGACEAAVLNVQIQNGVITHTLDAPLAEGSTVHGQIDWAHRFSNMQQHSGEHIFSGLVHSHFGFDNVGFHLSDQIVTMDFNGVLSAADVAEMELLANRAITENVEIQVSYPTKEEQQNLEYRSKIEIEGKLRIVTIPGYDVCACCAPHVRRTGEIGMLKVMSVQNYKGGVRISILCGFRALMAFREKAAVVEELIGAFTCGQDMLVDNILKLKAANQSLKSELGSARQQLLEHKLENIPQEQPHVILFETGLDMNAVRNAVNKLAEAHDGLVGFFVEKEQGYQYILGSHTMDCSKLAQALREELSARGGGSQTMIQGSVTADRVTLEHFLETYLGEKVAN